MQHGSGDGVAYKSGSPQVVKKKTHRDHSQLGADFVAPDGGFGWFICFAAGFSNVRVKWLIFYNLIH